MGADNTFGETNFNPSRRPLEKFRLQDFYNKVNYRLQYVDYEANDWTIPCLLTEYRADKFCADFSVSLIKLVPLPGLSFIHVGNIVFKEITLGFYEKEGIRYLGSRFTL